MAIGPFFLPFSWGVMWPCSVQSGGGGWEGVSSWVIWKEFIPAPRWFWGALLCVADARYSFWGRGTILLFPALGNPAAASPIRSSACWAKKFLLCDSCSAATSGECCWSGYALWLEVADTVSTLKSSLCLSLVPLAAACGCFGVSL